MIIKEIHISNALSLEDSSLIFGDDSIPNSVSVFYYNPNFPAKYSISTAVELIVSTKYRSEDSVQEIQNAGKGLIWIKFLLRNTHRIVSENNDETSDNGPCTSKQAAEREVARIAKTQNDTLIASRDLKSPNFIRYSLNDANEETCSVEDFQNKFTTCVEDCFPFLKKLYTEKDDNFLHFWIESICPHLDIACNTFKELQETRVRAKRLEIPLDKDLDFIDNLFHAFLFINIEKDICRKLTMLLVSNGVRTVFEYITDEQYTVKFYIPYEGDDIDMNDIVVEELDFANLKTYIKLRSDSNAQKFLWTNAEEGIKELLFVALDISFAKYCNRKFIFIRHTDAIKDMQTRELTCEAFLQNRNPDSSKNWHSKNYLQRIVDMCNHINVTAIIEYTGGLPLPPQKANIVRGFINAEGLNEFRIQNDLEWTSLDAFINHLEEFFSDDDIQRG